MSPVHFLLRWLVYLVLGVIALALGEVIVERWHALIVAAKKRAKETE